MRTVYPEGTTLYKPNMCYNGYTLLWRGSKVKLIDMNGRTVHEWQVKDQEFRYVTPRAKLLRNGNVVTLVHDNQGMMSQVGKIVEYDWDNNLVWEYIPEGCIPHKRFLGPHHDFFRKPNGNTLVVCREAVPSEYMKKVRHPLYQNITFYGDAILEVNPDCSVVWEWHGYEHLDLNQYRLIASSDWFAGSYNNTDCDWMHVNTVQSLPENKWYDNGDDRFKPGSVMISPRMLDTVYLIDRDSKKVVWSYSGDYRGGLSGQHEPYMLEKGLPGEGNILIFDNGASPWKDLAHCSCSYVLEVNPVTKEIVWKYENGEQFHSRFTSSAQRLPNGNTLICESAGNRIFEVTRKRLGATQRVREDIVWEYVEGTSRAYRYAYDYCAQTQASGKPKEVSVTPPPDMKVEPDQPLD